MLASEDSTRCRTFLVNNQHVVATVNLDPKAASAAVDLQVDPGRTLTLPSVEPEGKPIATHGDGARRPVLELEKERESPTVEIASTRRNPAA